ncbi:MULTISPECIES: hypothetical protein [Paraburkholderia]|jgi:hypothetical protein|uniref:Uncharacterized protein n=1 Tax=Paraburkholderia terricola TaxID=169427 RepID=A0A1M6YZ37_9BURK|nr:MULTISPECIES: hypothetical protein [Paraburkholderia]SDP10920.1 hypothetical protein SAMN05192547_10423 [Paraburkholderia sediminicola]SHL23352.1 hypothetical protein SAMN05192548_10823 [Paraburkholderia terricola]
MNVPTRPSNHASTLLSATDKWIPSPPTPALTLGGQKTQRSNAGKVGSEPLPHDRTGGASRTAQRGVHLGNSLKSVDSHLLLLIIHEASGLGMMCGNMKFEKFSSCCASSDATSEDFITHSGRAECEFTGAHASHSHFLRQTTAFANAVDREELARLQVIYNVAMDDRITLNQLYDYQKATLGRHDVQRGGHRPAYGPARDGDIRHSQANVGNADRQLGDDARGFNEAIHMTAG